MNRREIVKNQLKHLQTERVPYSLPMEKEVADKLDSYYGTTEWRSRIEPFIHNPLAVSTIREEKIREGYGRDAYGSIWRTDKRPWHLHKPVLEEASLKNFEFPSLSKFLDPLEKVNAREKALQEINEHGDKFQLITMGWGIFEQTWRIRGFENALVDSITEPDFYEELIGRITDLYVGMVKYCADVPADAILFGDDWGDQRGIILGPENWRKLIKPAWKRVYEEVHKQGKYVISHSCGSVTDIIPDIIEIGMDMLESVQPEASKMNPYELKDKWGDKLSFWGALGSQSIIPFGTPDEIKVEVAKLKKEMSKNGGYILAPAKPLQIETPAENAAAILEAFNA